MVEGEMRGEGKDRINFSEIFNCIFSSTHFLC